MRCIKLDIRLNLFDEVEVNIDSVYTPLPTKLLEEFADLVRKFAADNLEALTNPLNQEPTAHGIRIPPL
jgi:shikimate 5-dehydrogenase